MSMVADLGIVPLEEVSSSRAFNLKRIHRFGLYSKFAQAARLESHHTYAVLINTRERRGLFVVRVDDYEPNKRVNLSYAVKEYQLLDVRGESKGLIGRQRIDLLPCAFSGDLRFREPEGVSTYLCKVQKRRQFSSARAIRLRGISAKTSRSAFSVVRTRCSIRIWPASFRTQYQLLRSPRPSPIVSFC
jgi:hypothetical protein